MNYKVYSKTIFGLVLGVSILFGSVLLVYTTLANEVFELRPAYMSYHSCDKDYDYVAKKNVPRSEAQIKVCREKVLARATEEEEAQAQRTYLYTIVLLIFALPLYFFNRKGLL